jgi:hypothetical protein
MRVAGKGDREAGMNTPEQPLRYRKPGGWCTMCIASNAYVAPVAGSKAARIASRRTALGRAAICGGVSLGVIELGSTREVHVRAA